GTTSETVKEKVVKEKVVAEKEKVVVAKEDVVVAEKAKKKDLKRKSTGIKIDEGRSKRRHDKTRK
ncbi:hypothetical protein A2U01_0064846, partial [Trifolium medium]|nr:hypothetical protein [Trifolium medium]